MSSKGDPEDRATELTKPAEPAAELDRTLDAGAAGFELRSDRPDSTTPDIADSQAPTLPGVPGAAAPGLTSSSPAPQKLGRYTLFGVLGRGGMGEVLRANDPELGREVAIKRLLPRFQGRPEIQHRFLEEAQITGQLQHPGVLPVFELGHSREGHFFAMKLIEGRTLASLLAERAGPESDRPRFLAIFEQIAQTLAYAHAKGVIHRDLKPSNVMVGAFGEVQVLDWGLGKVLGVTGETTDSEPAALPPVVTARSHDEASHSLPGSAMGTPAYMPPEQARGEIDRLDRRADVFTLGGILCELLTGAPPFDGQPGSGRSKPPRHGRWRRKNAGPVDSPWRCRWR